MTLEEKFWIRVNKTETCWLWTGSISKDGYGRFFLGAIDGKSKIVLAHRWSYERHVGPIPEGLVIDHLAEVCPNRNCVNPDHLEAVTSEVNVTRGHEARRERRRKTHCVHGHEYAIVGRRTNGTCAECAREAMRAWHRTKNTPEHRAQRAEAERIRRQDPEVKEMAREYRRVVAERANAKRRERYAAKKALSG